MKNVLITGGAGYKGTLLAQACLERGCKVTVLDNFMYGFGPLLSFSSNPRCAVVKQDIRNLKREHVAGHDVIFHLAGISGYPACEANPHSAQTINVESTRALVNMLDANQILVYASTTSIYGQSGQRQDETAHPTPVSLYGMTKYEAERICMARPNAVALRFATLFGPSLRMRCDLLVNDFVHKAVTERCLVLFDEHSVRTFLHVRDAIAAYLMILDDPEKFVGQVLNVGSEDMNFSKLQIAEHTKQAVPYVEIVHSSLDDMDRRDFIIDFSRIAKLGFRRTVGLDEGIRELVRLYQWYRPYIPYQTI